MRYRLLDSLGLEDARRCNKDFGASLSLVPADLAKGSIVDLPETAAKFLAGGKPNGRGLVALLERAEKVSAVAKTPEITAPAKDK